MELDRRHLHRPDHVGEFGHTELVGVLAVPGKVEPDGLDPVGSPGRNPLLVDLPTRQPLGKPVQHARSLAQRVHDPVADGEVVLHEVELRESEFREVDAFRVGDPDGADADLQFDGGGLRGGHDPTLAKTARHARRGWRAGPSHLVDRAASD
ncbi:MAG: hypothetical protein R2715_19010 [Ilumatobacteraceae bacterium]